jgi:hypothetical protein
VKPLWLLLVGIVGWAASGVDWSREAVGETGLPVQIQDAKSTAAPDDELARTISNLERIMNAQSENDSKLSTLSLKGRVSYLTSANTDIDYGESGDWPAPEWRDFSLLQRDGKKRFEVETAQKWAKRISGGKEVRLFDGESFYALNPMSLEIAGGGSDPVRIWSNYTNIISSATQVHDGTHFMPVASACREHIKRLKSEDDDYYAKQGLKLECFKDNALLVVSLTTSAADRPPYKSAFWVDPKKNCCLVKSSLQQGAEGRGLYAVSTAKCEWQEAGPGVFCLSNSTKAFAQLGTVATREGQAGWGRRNVEVADVALGEIEVNSDTFDPDTLPIEEGTHVRDLRLEILQPQQ